MATTTTTKDKEIDIKTVITTTSNQCTQILSDLINSVPPSSSDSTAEPPTILAIRTDFISISTLLGKECTALSLASKPPLSAFAMNGVILKLSELLSKLAFCVSLLHGPNYKATALGKEINWAAQELVEGVQRLLDGTLVGVEATGKKAKEVREVNLRLTGLVWEKVERIKEVSEDELQASRREWKDVLGLLDDCLEEVKEMESGPPTGDEDEDDEEDDNSDDFRLSHPLSPLEKARVSAVYMILRLSRLLLSRLITSTAPSKATSFPSFSTSPFLPTVRKLISSLSEKSDDVAGSLEPPQVTVEEEVDGFVGVGESIASEIEKALEGLEGKGEKEREQEKKWVEMWKEQIGKAKEKLRKVESEIEVA